MDFEADADAPPDTLNSMSSSLVKTGLLKEQMLSSPGQGMLALLIASFG